MIQITEEILNYDTNYFMDEDTHIVIQQIIKKQLETLDSENTGHVKQEDGQEILRIVLKDCGAPQ